MTSTKSDLLLEIGCEELPASFVESALTALPGLAKKRFGELRLGFGEVTALGTPRRLALVVEGLDDGQSDLDEDVMGPPVKAAFKDGAPTRAAEAFAEKVGVPVGELRRVETPKGEYVTATRKEKGRPASELLTSALESLIREIPFRKSMRWGSLDVTFGRPIQWMVALHGSKVVDLSFAGIRAGRTTLGHRFVAPEGADRNRVPVSIEVDTPLGYKDRMRAAHVLVDPKERRDALARALAKAASDAKGTLIEDAFLMEENTSLVEEPFVVVGDFETPFLELPERVILEVARGHQRYFCMRDASGKLMPNYLAVVNTALDIPTIKRGNDSVMRARLADARFFYQTDLAVDLETRREKLSGVVFQKRLGSVLEKCDRVEALVATVGSLVGKRVEANTIATAQKGAHLSKCDLVALMVGEFPELQGEMGRAYAIAQGQPVEVADVIRDHYKPKGAGDDTASSDAAALVAIADRLDTLVGCFAIGLAPTGAADPFALRRACLGILRTLLDRGFDAELPALVDAAYASLTASQSLKLDLSLEEARAKIVAFCAERLRGLLSEQFAPDAVRACLATGAERPVDDRARVAALSSLEPATRALVGEVFKRATNIAKEAPAGEPTAVPADAHASEIALDAAYRKFKEGVSGADESDPSKIDYAAFLREVAAIAPVMEKYFVDVFVMAEDPVVRDNRLRLMAAISRLCRGFAHLELLVAT